MYDKETGMYFETTEDWAYELESTYYINFHTDSALYALRHILDYANEKVIIFDSACEYYHFYCDHLIFSIGQISNRFKITGREYESIRKQKELNIRNFDFNAKDYPELSKKQIRNTIEHIDEYDNKIILESSCVGGFNVIDDSSNEKLKQDLKGNRKNHPYTLNLVEKKLWVTRNDDELTLDLIRLRQELNRVHDKAQNLWHFITLLHTDPNNM